MIRLTPDRAALLNEVAALEGQRPDLGGLVEEGARARLERLRHAGSATRCARHRLAERVRRGTIGHDPDAADRVKRLGLEP